MANIEDCPGFETFGADVKAAREAKRLARKTLAEMVGIEYEGEVDLGNATTDEVAQVAWMGYILCSSSSRWC